MVIIICFAGFVFPAYTQTGIVKGRVSELNNEEIKTPLP